MYEKRSLCESGHICSADLPEGKVCHCFRLHKLERAHDEHLSQVQISPSFPERGHLILNSSKVLKIS